MKSVITKALGASCVAAVALGSLVSPAAAQDPHENELVSSFQRTCDNITASVNNPSNQGIKLRASCLNSDGNSVPTSIDLRGVHRNIANNIVVMSPTSKWSSNLAGCSVTNVSPEMFSVEIDITCSGQESVISAFEITNNNGSLSYETDKIYRLAAEALAGDVEVNGAPINVDDDLRKELEARIEGLLRSEDENPQSGNASRLMPRGVSHILLDRNPDYDQAMVIAITNQVNDFDGVGFTNGIVALYDNPAEALTSYENILAEQD